MKAGQGYLPEESIYPFLGLDTTDPGPIQANPRFSPDILNCLVTRGLVQKRKGYTLLTDTIDGSEATPDGVPMALITFTTLGETQYLVLLTTTKQYHYDGGTGEWRDITYSGGDWTGDETDIVQWYIATGIEGRWLIITNNKDQPRYWDGTGTFQLFAPDIPDFVTCKTISQLGGHLILGNYSTSSDFPQSVTWSDTNTLTNFTGVNSGEGLITELKGSIQVIKRLGDRVLIYSDDGISSMSYIGGDQLFLFEGLMEDTRLLGPRAVADLGPFHLFSGRENIVVSDGTRLLRTVGDQIQRSYREEVNLEFKMRAFSFVDTPKNNVYFAIPINENETVVFLLEYDALNSNKLTWTRLEYPTRPTCMGWFSRTNTLTWENGDQTQKWSEVAGTWDQGSGVKGFPVRVIGFEDGTVVLADDLTGTDSGEDISSHWQSVDFLIPQIFESELARWMELELDLRGTESTIEYSLDEGRNWTLISVTELASEFSRFKLDFDTTSRKIRFRISENTTGYFELRWLRTWLQASGPY